MTAAETLRAAAAKLRKTADLALMDVLTNPFWESEIIPAEDQSGRYAHGLRGGMGGPAGDLAALFTPATVVALAEWLDATADEMTAADGTEYEHAEYASWTAALTLARLVLGVDCPGTRKETQL